MASTDTDDFIGKRFGVESQVEVLGWFGDKTKSSIKYTVVCHICKLDKELNGDAKYLCSKANLLSGRIPCGCSKKHMWTKEQYAVLLSRKCPENMKFIAIEGEFRGSQSLVTYECNFHGRLAPKKLGSALNKVGCIFCRNAAASNAKVIPIEIISKQLMEVGVFPEGTVFRRSPKKLPQKGCKYGAMGYLYVDCPVCNQTGESLFANLRKGKRSCGCSLLINQVYAYIHTVSDNSGTFAIKFGVSCSPKTRLQKQRTNSTLQINHLGTWKFQDRKNCWQAERDVKLTIPTGIIDQCYMRDGFTETCDTSYIDLLISIYVNNGGVRIK